MKESLRLKVTSGDYLVEAPCSKQGLLEPDTQRSRAVKLLFTLLHLLRILRRSFYDHLMITTAKAAPNFHILLSFLDCKYEAQHPFIGSMIISIERLSVMDSRSRPDCLCSAVLPLQASKFTVNILQCLESKLLGGKGCVFR